MQANPFKRAQAMMAAISMAIASGVSGALIPRMFEYESRGKGGKHRARCARQMRIPNRGRYTPHQGAKECARRMAKMNEGGIA